MGAERGEGFCWGIGRFGIVGVKGEGCGDWERGVWGVGGKQRKIWSREKEQNLRWC